MVAHTTEQMDGEEGESSRVEYYLMLTQTADNQDTTTKTDGLICCYLAFPTLSLSSRPVERQLIIRTQRSLHTQLTNRCMCFLLLLWTTKQNPIYQEEAPPAKEADTKESTDKSSTDWWTGSDYNGRKYPSPKVKVGVNL